MDLKEKIYVSPSDRKSFDVKVLQKKDESNPFEHDDFYAICDKARDFIYDFYDKKIAQKSKGEIEEDYVEIYHQATLGIPGPVKQIKKLIEGFLTEDGFNDTEYPSYYLSLKDGIFEEEFGWGPLSAFRQEKNCEGAQVIGVDITFKRSWGYETQPFSFRNIEKVLELTKRFSNSNETETLSSVMNPEIETKTHDEIRVSIMIPQRTFREPVITLRRKVITALSFEKQAELGTIPIEAIPLLKSLSRFSLNGIVAGPPGCGKSTMLHTLMHHALYELKDGKKVPARFKTVYAESYPEFDARDIHPKSNLIHVIAKGTDFEKVLMKSLLRQDITAIVVGEIREHEAGLFKRASVQGIKKLWGSLHDSDPLDIPRILTDLYLQYYSNSLNDESVYRTFVRNLHFSISMDEFLFEKNGIESLQKKVTGIHFYDIDTETKETKLFTILEYDVFNEKWHFNNEIPERIGRMVAKYNRREYIDFTDILQQLSEDAYSVGMVNK